MLDADYLILAFRCSSRCRDWLRVWNFGFWGELFIVSHCFQKITTLPFWKLYVDIICTMWMWFILTTSTYF